MLRLGIPPMVGMMMAGPISLFRQRYPGVELKISEFGGLTVQQAVTNGELDVAMTASPLRESGLATLPLFSHPLCVLVPRSGDWLKRDSVKPELLGEYPLLIYNEDFALSRQLMTLFNQHSVKPRIAVRSGQWDFLGSDGAGRRGLPFCRSRFASVWIKHAALDPTRKRTAAGDDLARRDIFVAQRPAWLQCCEGFWVPHPNPLTGRGNRSRT